MTTRSLSLAAVLACVALTIHNMLSGARSDERDAAEAAKK